MTSSTGDGAFYDRVAAKFGGYVYRDGEPPNSYFPEANPEAVFEAMVVAGAGSEAVALDIGCADGVNALKLAPHFRRLVGIDVSEGMLALARLHQVKVFIENAAFELQDASATSFADATFDVVYSRRGPTFYEEVARLLKPGGTYVEIQIGELDAREVKEVFGRGQDYGDWDRPFLDRNAAALTAAGLRVTDQRSYRYEDFFAGAGHFSRFLEGVPIFTDYDVAADRPLFEAYVECNTLAQGVLLRRHRIVIAARKAG